MIPYGRQEINQADIDAVVDVLQSDYLTQGPVVPMFEKTIARYCGAKHAIAVNSATSALHIACLALGLKKGDRVWTSPNTFVASANCALYCGAQVDFVDIDPQTYNLCPIELEKKLEQAHQANNLPKIVIPVHFAGQSCDMRRIHKLSQQYGFKIIEDASHAIGAEYLEHKVGCGKYADITVFSFHPVKIITTGEGGVATTNHDRLAEKLQLFRSHGVTREPHLMTTELEGAWYYQQVDLGFNYRMTEIQAALGISQMQRVDEFIAARTRFAARYDELLANLPLTLPFQHQSSRSSFHLYPILIDSDKVKKSRAEIFAVLRESGIGVNIHYIPVHTQPFYQKMGFATGDFPRAEEYYKKVISIPVFQSMTECEQDKVVEVLTKVLR